jgi:hypothetical protein
LPPKPGTEMDDGMVHPAKPRPRATGSGRSELESNLSPLRETADQRKSHKSRKASQIASACFRTAGERPHRRGVAQRGPQREKLDEA